MLTVLERTAKPWNVIAFGFFALGVGSIIGACFFATYSVFESVKEGHANRCKFLAGTIDINQLRAGREALTVSWKAKAFPIFALMSFVLLGFGGIAALIAFLRK